MVFHVSFGLALSRLGPCVIKISLWFGFVSYLFELAIGLSVQLYFVVFSSIDVVFFGPLDWLRAALGLNLCCN